jgi:NAD-dependent SIR2 family protein deacetylase
VCGGILKPDVVFFGEFVPLKVYQAATSHVKRADCLLIAGSSLAVNSGLRLIEIARKKRMPIVIINRGETKGDKYASLKLNAGTSEVLEALAQGLGAHLLEDIE